MDRETHEATLHSKGGCADGVTLNMLQEGGDIRRWEADMSLPVLEVDFIEKSRLRVKATPVPANSMKKNQSPKLDPELDCYVRIGRRAVDDDKKALEPVTEALVVAHIETIDEKLQFTWLSVPTWRLNGLRIGDCETGDPILETRDMSNFDSTQKLRADPYYSAWDVSGARKIKEHLLELAKHGQLGKTVQETWDEEDVAQEESDTFAATHAMRMRQHEPWSSDERLKVIWGESALIDAKARWPHPWHLPIKPIRSRESFSDHRLEVRAKTPPDSFDVDAIVVFANRLCDKDLGLTSYFHELLEDGKSLKEVKKDLKNGGKEGIGGFANNHVLQQYKWKFELWVLPQRLGCSKMYLWDQDYSLLASDFCDPEAMEKDGGKPKLFVQIRIYPG